MSVSRYEDVPRHRAVQFLCDADNCDEELETGYSMYAYAIQTAKDNGWYIMPSEVKPGQWLHLCPAHGKAEWIRRKEAEGAK